MAEASNKMTLMIVDDDELIRRVVEIYFTNRGHRVISAVDGADCLEQLRLCHPDVILLDVTMPGLDGWEVCRRIREFSDVPVAMLTARAQQSDREKGSAVGANTYVTKPVSLKELDTRIRELVR
jgi:two-component system KDP operon response regulator KdpE